MGDAEDAPAWADEGSAWAAHGPVHGQAQFERLKSAGLVRSGAPRPPRANLAVGPQQPAAVIRAGTREARLRREEAARIDKENARNAK